MQRYVPEITVFRIRSVCNVTYEVLKPDCITMVLAAWELNGAPQIAPLPVTLMQFPYFICIKFVSHAGLVSSHTSDLLSHVAHRCDRRRSPLHAYRPCHQDLFGTHLIVADHVVIKVVMMMIGLLMVLLGTLLQRYTCWTRRKFLVRVVAQWY